LVVRARAYPQDLVAKAAAGEEGECGECGVAANLEQNGGSPGYADRLGPAWGLLNGEILVRQLGGLGWASLALSPSYEPHTW
jgi:hypothetical protein